ncbi:hypothetical protein MMC17_009440 [Xylographa soralifera]|nr:hypothetical protein [Xylographa soralifera]
MSAPYVHNAPPDLEIGSKEWHDFYESNKKWPKQWVDVLYTKGLGLSSEHHAELKKDIAINLDRLNLRNVNLKSKEVQNTVTGLAQTLIKQYQSKMRNAAATKSYTFRAISGEISRVKGTKLKAVKQERWETPIDIDAADESAPPSTLSVADNTSDQTRKRSISAVNEENRQSSFDSRSQAGSSQGNRFDPKFSRMRVSREYYIYTYVQQLELEHYCLIHDITRITAEQNPTIDDLDYERWTVSLAQYLSEVDLSLKDVRICIAHSRFVRRPIGFAQSASR